MSRDLEHWLLSGSEVIQLWGRAIMLALWFLLAVHVLNASFRAYIAPDPSPVIACIDDCEPDR